MLDVNLTIRSFGETWWLVLGGGANDEPILTLERGGTP